MMLCKQESKRPTYDVDSLEKVHTDDEYNVFAIERQHYEQPESINDTYIVKMVDSNVISHSSDMCNNEGKSNQNADETENECVLLVSLKVDVDENKNIQKQLKKANTSLTQELEKSKQYIFYGKSELEKYINFQTNHKDKEKAELQCEKALDDANPSSPALRNELSYLEKKIEIELWLENNRSVDSLVSSDNEFEEEIEI
uniref:Uncharacterized protein n=1 Tax=Tanacetum cinerariifolium TaxID=118510 RepID=A0A6L2KH72_TANCI|nr:hypothetical protein [Tanacetum cinerariifolium]